MKPTKATFFQMTKNIHEGKFPCIVIFGHGKRSVFRKESQIDC